MMRAAGALLLLLLAPGAAMAQSSARPGVQQAYAVINSGGWSKTGEPAS